ncbi:MAG: T9SS type A sorting domain-containing protein [Sphingobacteriales bacterium]|nr:T9SS type A sorting domain-containing protein [Sphingobacteriales bacterium]
MAVGNYRGGLSLYSATTYSAIFEAAAPAKLQLLQAVPNPVAQGACRLQWQPMHPDNKDGLLRLSVYTALGTLVSEQTLPPDTSEMLLHTENWLSGVYIVQLKKGTSVVASGKIAVVE